jgi:hypothetical protein
MSSYSFCLAPCRALLLSNRRPTPPFSLRLHPSLPITYNRATTATKPKTPAISAFHPIVAAAPVAVAAAAVLDDMVAVLDVMAAVLEVVKNPLADEALVEGLIVEVLLVRDGVVVRAVALAGAVLVLPKDFVKSASIADAKPSTSAPSCGNKLTRKEGSAGFERGRVPGISVTSASRSDKRRDPSSVAKAGMSAMMSVGTAPGGMKAVSKAPKKLSMIGRSDENIAGRSETTPWGSRMLSKLASRSAAITPPSMITAGRSVIRALSSEMAELA